MAASDDCVPNTLPVNGLSFHTVCLAAAQVPTADRRRTHLKFASPAHFTGAWEIHLTMRSPRRTRTTTTNSLKFLKRGLPSPPPPTGSQSPYPTNSNSNSKLKLKVQCTCSLFPLSAGIAGLTEPGGPHKTTKNFFFFFKHGWIILISRLLVDGLMGGY